MLFGLNAGSGRDATRSFHRLCRTVPRSGPTLFLSFQLVAQGILGYSAAAFRVARQMVHRAIFDEFLAVPGS